MNKGVFISLAGVLVTGQLWRRKDEKHAWLINHWCINVISVSPCERKSNFLPWLQVSACCIPYLTCQTLEGSMKMTVCLKLISKKSGKFWSCARHEVLCFKLSQIRNSIQLNWRATAPFWSLMCPQVQTIQRGHSVARNACCCRAWACLYLEPTALSTAGNIMPIASWLSD